MKITIEVSPEQFLINHLQDRLNDIFALSGTSITWDLAHESGELQRPPAENNGAAQETVEEVRAVAEVHDAHVEPEANDQEYDIVLAEIQGLVCLLYTSPSPRDS